MASSRIVFLLGTLIAIFGTADAAVSTCTGAANTVYNTENNPGGTGVIACKCVAGYVSTGVSNTIVIGDATLTCTKCAPGYYFSAGSDTATAVCTQAPANKYHAGLKDLTSTYTAETATACPTNSESVAGSSLLADCKVKAGYYIATKSDSATDAASLVISIAPTNWYAAGGASASEQDATAVAATRTARPYAGTTPATGKTVISDCVPNCGTAGAAEGTVDATLKTKVQGGTCVCAETHYGQPVDAALSTAAAPTQGCTGAPTLTIATGKILNSGDTIEPPTGHSARIGDLFTLTGGTGSGIAATKRYMVMSLSSGKITVRLLDVAANPANGAVVEASGDSTAAATLAPAGHAFTITCTHATNLFTTPYAHGLSTGDKLLYKKGGGTIPGGLTNDDVTSYYVVYLTSTTFSLSDKPGGAAKAISSTPADIAKQYVEYHGVKGFTIPTAGIDITTDTITFAAHGLSNGDQVTYNNGGGTAAAGLTDGVRYFVRDVTTNTFKVSATPGGSAADITATGNDAQFFDTVAVPRSTFNVFATGGACPTGSGTGSGVVSGTEAGSSVTTLATDGDGVTALGQCAVKAGYYIGAKSGGIGSTASLTVLPAPLNFYAAGGLAVDQQEASTNAGRTACPFVGTTGRAAVHTANVASSVFTSAGHGLSDGDQVIYQSGTGNVATVGGSNIVDGNVYYVRDATTNTFKIASTSGGTALVLAAGTATQYFTPSGKSLVTQCTPGASTTVAQSAVDITAETITSTAHGLSNGDQITYKQVSSGQVMSPLSADTAYYVRDAATNTFKVASTPGGAALDITNDGHDAQYFIVPSSGNCGASTVNAEKNAGTCRCKADFYGTPVAGADGVAASGCTACPFGGTSTAGSTAVTDCTPAQTSNTGGCGAVSVNAVAVGGTCHCKAGYYGTPTSTTSGAVATGGCTACPANSVSVAGTSTTIADCKVSAGYYLSAAKTGSATYGTITQAAANKYAAGGTAVNANSADAAPTACPYGGTSAAGSSVVEDCVPDCGASTVNAVNARGTCICAPNYYGAPTSTTSGAVATGGCTACPVNTEAVAGTAAKTSCTVKAGYYMQHFVIATSAIASNVITSNAHGLSDGDQVAYQDATSTSLTAGGTAIADDTILYVRDITTNTFKLAATSGGTALVLAAGNNNQFFTNILQVPANSYGAGGASSSLAVTGDITATKTACPYAGTSAAGSDALADCTPSCGTASTVKTAANGGTCVCASTHFGTPVDADGLTTAAAVAGCAVIAQSAVVLQTAITEATPGVITMTAHGYYTGLKIVYNNANTKLVTGSSDTASDGEVYYVVKASADTFSLASSYTNAMAGTKLQISTDGHDGQKFTPDSSGACPAYTQTAYTAAVAGTGTLADCEVAAGFRISAKSATITAATINAPGSMAASQVDANFYAPGAYDANLQASVSLGAGTSFACPFAGTTARGAGKLSDCTPNCGTGTNAVALGGTCVCASTHFGSPVDVNGATAAAVTQGCSPVAQTVVIPQYAITEATPGVITLAGHGFYTGQAIAYNRDGTGTQLTTGSSDAVADDAVLYVIKISADTFKLQLTHAAAVAGTDLQISNDGHDTQRFTPVSSGACPTNSETAYTATGVPGYSQVPRALPILGAAPGTNPSGVTTASDTFTYKAHSLLDGDELTYNAGGGTVATGLTDGNTYFVVSGLTDTFKVSATSGGSAVAISGVGSDNQFFTTVTSRAGAGTVADCKVKAGYYIATESTTASDATGLVISSVPANSYGAGGASATEQDNAAVAATKSACVVKSTSPAASDAISDCVTAPGFYLSVASPSATGSGRIAKSEVNKFSAGGTSISTTTAETATACTYGGTSAIGSVVAGCTPSCGTVADASSGTCVCKAGRTGTPTPTTATVTGGCTATLCAANQKVTSNACTACGAGTNNAAGDDASGADTTCDAITCTADHYVSSNVCTDCAAGSTNAAGDDATGADTTCDIVSGASPLEVKLTSMISFLVIGFLALAM